MQGAFVLRLGLESKPSKGHFEGSIEEVDSGKEFKFESLVELIKFLSERFEDGFAHRPGNAVQRPTGKAEQKTRGKKKGSL